MNQLVPSWKDLTLEERYNYLNRHFEVFGWLDDIDYIVTEEDAGDHVLVITYSDGVNEVSQSVKITVNRPPVFEI